MPQTVTSSYVQQSLTPYKWADRVIREDYNVAANQVIPQGGVCAQTTGANTDEVWSVVGSSAVGTFKLIVGNALQQVTTAINPASLTAAAFQSALNAAFQALCPSGPSTGYVTVTGSAWSSGGSGTFTVTFNNGTANTGILSNNPQTLPTVVAPVTSGSVAVTETTKGINNSALVNYNNAVIAAPTTGPTVAGAGSGSSFAAGAYEVAVTYANSLGVETAASYGTEVTLTAGQNISVTSITGLGSYVAKVNVYVDGLRAASVAPSSGATGTISITAPPSASAAAPPSAEFAANNPSYQATDGSQIPVGFAWYAMAAAPNGVITFGASAPSGNEYKPNWYSGNCANSGAFNCANLSVGGAAGVDQNTVNTLGRLLRGSISTGVILAYGP